MKTVEENLLNQEANLVKQTKSTATDEKGRKESRRRGGKLRKKRNDKLLLLVGKRFDSKKKKKLWQTAAMEKITTSSTPTPTTSLVPVQMESSSSTSRSFLTLHPLSSPPSSYPLPSSITAAASLLWSFDLIRLWFPEPVVVWVLTLLR